MYNHTDPREARKQPNWLPGPGAQNNPKLGPQTIKNVPKQSKNVNSAAYGGVLENEKPGQDSNSKMPKKSRGRHFLTSWEALGKIGAIFPRA